MKHLTTLSRRRLLRLLPLAAAHASLPAQMQLFKQRRKPKSQAMQPLVYIGTDTNHAGAKGIYQARFDARSGRLSEPVLAATCFRPAYLAANQVGKGQPGAPERHILYVTNEGDAKTSAVSSYQMDPATGALTLLGQVSSAGAGPCYVAVDASGRSAYVANYAGGTIASYRVQPDGTLSEPVDRVDFHDQSVFGHHGPMAARQDGPHPHSSMVTPDNRFLVVNDLGDDSIAIFPIDAKTAHLGKPHLFQSLSPGSGPRHVAFHPNGRWAYGIDELASRIDQYLYTSMRGGPGLEAQAILTGADHSVSTLDAGFHGTNTAAEIVMAPDGDVLYASNRGEDSLVVFAIDQTNGMLSFRQRIACGGKTPRHFTLDRHRQVADLRQPGFSVAHGVRARRRRGAVERAGANGGDRVADDHAVRVKRLNRSPLCVPKRITENGQRSLVTSSLRPARSGTSRRS